eukprot:SM000019S05061  [mRNA]  locus=s19:698378:702152:+ [translate_table: standard]
MTAATTAAAATSREPTPPPGNPFRDLNVREYVGHRKSVHSVAWNSTGRKLASGSTDYTANIWHIDPAGSGKTGGAGKEVELRGHTSSVEQVCWHPSHPDTVATCSFDRSVRLWDARSGKLSQEARLSGENINIAFNPEGTHIAIGNTADELTIIDVRKFKQVIKKKFTYEVNELSWNRKGDLFFVTTGNGSTVEVMPHLSTQTLHTVAAHTHGCYSIDFDQTGRYFAVGSADALVSLWDAIEMLCVRTFFRLEHPVRTLSFNYDGQYLASASEDLVIDICEVETGRLVHTLKTRAAANCVAFNPCCNLLAYATDETPRYNVPEGIFRVFGFEAP